MSLALMLAASLMAGPAAPANALTGRVLDASGEPLRAVTVRAYALEPDERTMLREAQGRPRTETASATTLADGTFRLETAGGVVEADGEGYAPVAVVAYPGTPATLVLRPARPVRGVVRAGDRPVAGALVVWAFGEIERITRTGADGTFELPFPGGWVRAFHPDFAPQWATVERGGSPLVVSLEPGAALRGTVADANGRPVARARIAIDAVPVGESDARGAFVIARAPVRWTSITARTDALGGSAPRAPGAVAIRVAPHRGIAGTVRDARSGKPIAAAQVTLMPDGGQANQRLVTDAAGRYSATGLPPDRYAAWVTADGYEAARQPIGEGWVDLRRAPAGRIEATLKPYERLSGRVEDERHQPVAGASVFFGYKGPRIYSRDFGDVFDTNPSPEATVMSEPDGSFTLTRSREQMSFDPFSKDRPVIAMKPGFAAGGADVPPAEGSGPIVITLPRGVELGGRVTDAAGAPIAGVEVVIAESGMFANSTVPVSFVLEQLPRASGWVTSGADGRFAARVQPIPHALSLRRTGYAPAAVAEHDPRTGPVQVVLDAAAFVRGRVAHADGRGIADATLNLARNGFNDSEKATSAADGTFAFVDLTPGTYLLRADHPTLGTIESRLVEAPAADVQIALGPTVTVRGQVVDAATRAPLSHFNVYSHTQADEQTSSRQLEVDDATGAFALPDVPVGTVTMGAAAEGYTITWAEPVELTADGDVPAIEIALPSDAPIRGTVTAEDGGALEKASVTAKGGQGSAKSDAAGRYELRGLAAGDIELTFQAEDYLQQTQRLDTRTAARLDVVMKRGLGVRGEVLWQGKGEPGVVVSAQGGESNRRTLSDDRGQFAIAGLGAGRHTLTAVTSDGRRATVENVDAAQGGAVRLVLERMPTATLHGRAVGFAGGTTSMVMVEAQSTGPERDSRMAIVDASGSFRMPDAPTGPVKVQGQAYSVDGAHRSSRAVELTLAPDSDTEVAIEFADDVVLRGVVTRERAAVPYASVTFSSPQGQAAAQTDPQGAYELRGLSAGRYDVAVVTNVGLVQSSFQTEYVVRESAEFDIDITGGSVSGRVVRADTGEPLSGVSVSLYRESAPGQPATTAASGAQGAFSARSLRDGRYRLITSKAGFGQEVRELSIAAGEETEVALELSPAEGVSVSVVDGRDGRALDAIVVVRDQARRIVANQHGGAGEDGVVNIPLANGSYLLSTSATGFGTATLPVTAPSAGLKVALTPGGTLVLESSVERHGRIRLLQPDGEEYVRCWCNGIATIQLEGRRTKVENVTPGAYTIELVDGDGAVPPRPAVIREGQTTTVTLE